MIAKRKTVTHTKAKKDLWKVFSEYIRLRDCLKTTKTFTHAVCYTCPSVKPFKLLDAGHFYGGRHNKYLFDEQQVHAQCKYCNGFMQGNGAMYYRHMVFDYGEKETNAILEGNKELVQHKTYQLVLMKEEFQQKIDKLKNENNKEG